MSFNATPLASPSSDLHPLLEQLVSRHGFTSLTEDTLPAVVTQGHALLVFTEDPVRYKETLDLAVIAPELVRAFNGQLKAGVFFPAVARKAATRYGFARWPALVVLSDGEYVGAIDGLRNWNEYVTEMQQLLQAAPKRAPSVGIAVTSATGSAGCGH